MVFFLVCANISPWPEATAGASPRVEVKQGQVFLDGSQVTASPGEKSMASLSPDGHNLLYLSRLSDTSLKAGIYNLATKSNQLVELTEDFLQVTDLDWLGNSKFALTIHVNPSMEIYSVYSVTTAQSIGRYYGYGFIVNQARTKILYIEAPPHFSQEDGPYKLMLNRKVLYIAAQGVSIDNSVAVSPSFNQIAFYETSLQNDASATLVVLTLAKNRVVSKKRFPWNELMPELEWDSEALLKIGDAAKYDASTGQLHRK
jgi:hypothetical protein